MTSQISCLAKSLNQHAIRKLIDYSIKFPVKAMFTLTVFEILLLVGRTVLSPAEKWVQGEKGYSLNKNVTVSNLNFLFYLYF